MATLAAIWNSPGKYNVHVIRDLAAPEFVELEKHLAEYRKLRERHSLVHIVDKSYKDLEAFITSIIDANGFQPSRGITGLNSHFMNYLSACYALREHLETALKRDFDSKSEHVVKFPQFLRHLEKTFFAYAFLQDFRNFAQHCGFPVGEVSMTESANGRTLNITYPINRLLRGYKEWKKCNLPNHPHANIDLLATVRSAHPIITQNFSAVIIMAYGKNLEQMDSCFTGFHKEAADVKPVSIAKVITSTPTDLKKSKMTTQDLPLDLFAELKLKRPGRRPVE